MFSPRFSLPSRLSGLLCAALLLAASPLLKANDPLAHIFQDNMVLQRGQPAPVWGWAAANTDVELSFAGQTKKVKADKDGYWKAILDPLTASKEGRDLTARVGGTSVTRKNVVVGEVWIAAGQSNMVAGGPDKDTGVYPLYTPTAGAGKPDVRLLRFGTGASLEPQADGDPERKGGTWEALAENAPLKDVNIPPAFARVVRDALNVPVGVISVAVPGTNQIAWMSRETIKQFPGDKPGTDYYDSFLADHEAKLAANAKSPFKSFAEYAAAEEAWKKAPTGQPPGRGTLEYANFPGVLYNTRLHPLAPLAIKGVIWHQGEAGPGPLYGQRLAAMIGQWRKLFGQDFYFIWGTLGRNATEPPPLSPVRTSFYRSINNVEIRKATEAFGKEGKATLVEFYDLGNTVTHFLEKAEAGRRMGLAALSLAYGQPRVFTGPRPVDLKITGNKATVRFDQVGTGLVYKPSVDGISGVYLRGKAGNPRWAQVKVIDKDTAEFSSPEISDLQTVDYGANSNPHETLFNNEGLPASPFTINPATGSDPAPTAELVSLQGKPPGMGLHVAHVRQEGYVFKIRQDVKKKAGADPDADTSTDAGGGKVTVQAYLPASWKKFEVFAGGAKVEAAESAVNGKRLTTFEAPVGAWIVVAEGGKADEFKKVDRF